MPYFPLGYPTPEISVDVIEALAKNGADLIEVGVPFSDPLADGPVIQRPTQIALQNGMTVARALAAVRELRARGVTIPLVLMSYYNPLMAASRGLWPLGLDAAPAGATAHAADQPEAIRLGLEDEHILGQGRVGWVGQSESQIGQMIGWFSPLSHDRHDQVARGRTRGARR